MEEKILARSRHVYDENAIRIRIVLTAAAMTASFFLGFRVHFLFLLPAPLCVVLLMLFAVGFSRCGSELVVTDTRIYFTVGQIKFADLLIDGITAVKLGDNNSISVFTPSGEFDFPFICNRVEILSVITEIINERQ